MRLLKGWWIHTQDLRADEHALLNTRGWVSSSDEYPHWTFAYQIVSPNRLGTALEVQTDDEDGWNLHVLIWKILGVYLSFKPTHWQLYPKKEREWGFHLVDNTLRLHCGALIGEWSHDQPWWWERSIDLADLFLGKNRYREWKRTDIVPISIPLPEGVYPAVARQERRSWKRPRWPRTLRRTSWYIDVPNGLPIPGKGENSYDLDDDGIYDFGGDGSLEKAIGRIVGEVLELRKERGGPGWAPMKGWQVSGPRS